jgi:hypothetical protein
VSAAVPTNLLADALVIECRAGGLARWSNRPADPHQPSAFLDMARWKALIDAAAARPDVPVAALFFGEANLVTGYRLYYLLRYAKRAGLRDVTLVTDGRFWIEEATTWLIESGLDRIAIVDRDAAEFVESRVAELDAARARAGAATPVVVRVAPGTLGGARTIDWRGEEHN